MSRRFLGKGLFLFLIISMTFFACGGDDDEGGEPETNNVSLDKIRSVQPIRLLVVRREI